MRSLRPRHRVTFLPLAALAALLGACGSDEPRPATDSAAILGSAPADAPPPRPDLGGWTEEDGTALLVQGSTPDEAIVLVPGDESAGLARLDAAAESAEAVLVGRGGAQFTARLGAVSSVTSAECRVRTIRDRQGDDDAAAWAAGFLGARVAPIALDSIDVLSSRDSSALAAEAARLASAVTAPSNASFQGLRFTAHDVRRFSPAPGIQALVAHLTRRVNQEANPQEEQTLLVAERDSSAAEGGYTLAFAERTHGLEEQIVAPEVIAAARLGTAARPTLVVARDGENGVAYALLERTGPRQWRVRWTSRATRCG